MATSAESNLKAQGNPDRSEQAYRDRWKWDKVVQSSHAVDCYPTVGNCPYRVYLKDGRIVDDTRIRSSLPTIRHALDHGASVVVASHLGRQLGGEEEVSLGQHGQKRPSARPLQNVKGL